MAAAAILDQTGETEAANARRAQARTHSRSSSSQCPDHKDRQRVHSKSTLGGVTKSYTLKHGLKNLIRHPDSAGSSLDESTKTKLIEAVEKVVDFNTDMTIKAHLFARYFLTTELHQPQPSLPAAIFTQIFFT
ncbi:hypothetical protein DM01DRAFT_1334229 [Hesseltinella vesiculosa]|uniref:Uncharacterized protein n=1 Tax=Hesseltinella vesiculosa TaxID=101127 RepID=A0A1X2GPP2_9FUNG|nr:hypothetical protein DM01DRAFT_1334229 [Hesseltinella vesiculosa]